MTTSVLCLGCAHIFVENKKGRFLICPKCGFKIGRGRFAKIINFSYEAVRYGYDYRLRRAVGTPRGGRWGRPGNYALPFAHLTMPLVRPCPAKPP